MSNTTDCVFCKEIGTGENFFADDSLFSARKDQFPVSPGHAEIIPKRHIQYFDELTDEELSHILIFAKEVMQQIRDELPTKPDAFNIAINDGPEAGQTVFHLHLHLIPRYKGDVENPKGGIRRIFPNDEYSNRKA
ncbi:MAG TPA: HIT family protein [Candidatus Saccharibacteria bacterium]|nr:HIT family protein [Candidatus Saccharibacteria bacterium]HRK94080.1 HIT family protein [Candidatus Saccharibacteria bacterium]